MVIDRGAFLSGDYRDGVRRDRRGQGGRAATAHLKVILETGELETYDNVRRASILAMAAGADFIKTSTGKVTPAATLPVTLVMLEAIRDFHRRTGRIVGMKPAGGIRTAKEAIHYLVVLYETLGPRWMTPDCFRFGASTPAQRRADAAAQGAHRPLPGTRLLHDRLRGAAGPGRRPVHGGRPAHDGRWVAECSLGVHWISFGLDRSRTTRSARAFPRQMHTQRAIAPVTAGLQAANLAPAIAEPSASVRMNMERAPARRGPQRAIPENLFGSAVRLDRRHATLGPTCGRTTCRYPRPGR